MLKTKISLKARALRYLSMREHSRLELTRKLSPYVEEGDDLHAVLEWLENSKFLSDERFSESLVHRRVARFGNHRILAELESHRLNGEEIEKVKASLQETEVARAIDVLHRKFLFPPSDPEEKMKQSRFLSQRGFSGKAIRAAMIADRDVDES